MTTTLKMTCNGCDAVCETKPIRKDFQSFDGKGHGFGVWRMPDIEAVVEATGWQWSDPYTSCTYCPKCWAEIVGKTDAA